MPKNSWHDHCYNNSIPSMPSEMTAMNSTLLLLNALALAVLVVFHFQPEPAASGQTTGLAGTYNKPLTPMPQLAVMTENDQVAPRLTAERPVAANIQGERWFF